MEFTEEERRYLVRDPFDWHPSEEAPAHVRKSINRKISSIDGQKAGPIGGPNRREHGDGRRRDR
jgi:hypothetical protein